MFETMSKKDLEDLKVGDIVRGKLSKISFLVTGNYGGRVTAVKTVDLTSPDNWEVQKMGYGSIKSK
jgi:hypothetical protein